MGLGLVAVGMVITFVGLGDKVSQFRNSIQRSSFGLWHLGEERRSTNFGIINLIDKLQGVKILKGLGPDCISRAYSAIWGKLGTALQAYTLSPCTKFPQNHTSRKVNT